MKHIVISCKGFHHGFEQPTIEHEGGFMYERTHQRNLLI